MSNEYEVRVVKVMLWAQDMDRAIAFHRAVFGFDVGFESPHFSELRHGDTVIAFHGGGDGSPQKSGLSVEVSDVDAAYSVACERGAIPLKEPEARPGEPIRLAEIRDPEGNEIMLTQYVG